ncbi:hypothetical protein Dsin_020786 [Dipteronia sinensis]|uniref:Reverse transcriptase domain-containing protein n=1 Tax=Dipteronia sinensis TaxID=43782 RepID=A0AAE0E404_9ROSI|nr:hypothetical protein Dsin_020786 [Dipteronia sinensis]
MISHLFFTDDSLLFTKADDTNYMAVRQVLDNYAMASGHVVNLDKLALCFSPSLSDTESVRLAAIVGVKLVDWHENYLGLLCFTCRSKRKIFSEIIDRVWARIKGRGDNLLLVGEKEVLIKAMIQVIPAYAMSLFRLPKRLIFKNQRLCTRFWLGGNMENKKIHWCTWNWLCKPKMEGGLGFRDLETNMAFLAKQCWRIFKNPRSLAARVLEVLWMRQKGFCLVCLE